jgi:hypothetical protein
MFAMDLTVELAPIFWAMVGLLFLSGAAIAWQAWPRQRQQPPVKRMLVGKRPSPRPLMSSRAAHAH